MAHPTPPGARPPPLTKPHPGVPRQSRWVSHSPRLLSVSPLPIGGDGASLPGILVPRGPAPSRLWISPGSISLHPLGSHSQAAQTPLFLPPPCFIASSHAVPLSGTPSLRGQPDAAEMLPSQEACLTLPHRGQVPPEPQPHHQAFPDNLAVACTPPRPDFQLPGALSHSDPSPGAQARAQAT